MHVHAHTLIAFSQAELLLLGSTCGTDGGQLLLTVLLGVLIIWMYAVWAYESQPRDLQHAFAALPHYVHPCIRRP